MRALGRTAALHPEPDIVRQPIHLDRLAGSLRLNPQNSLTRYWRERDSNYLRAVDRRVCRKVVRAHRHAEFPRKIVGGLRRRRRPRRTTSGRRWRRRSTRWLPPSVFCVYLGPRVRISLPPAESLQTLGPSRKLMRIEVERGLPHLDKGVGPRVRISFAPAASLSQR
jgi:hypothetical protein